MKISRRGFLGTSASLAGGVLVIGFHLNAAAQDTAGKIESGANPFDAWIHINPDSSAELVLAQSEMGQGVYTSLPMLLAEEADLDWERVTVVQSDSTKGTGGSGSVRSNYLPLRRAGSQLRWAMIAAAAQRWSVPASECSTSRGEVSHTRTGRKLAYGQLVVEASRIPLPDAKTIKLKEPSQFTLIGRPTPHLDIPDKCTGKARFGLDVRIPGMVYAVIARCPTFGGSPAQFDAAKALAVPGVLQVFEIPARGFRVFSAGGIVVVAKTTWAAMQGRNALAIQWNHGPNHGETTESLRAQMKEVLAKPPAWPLRSESTAPRSGTWCGRSGTAGAPPKPDCSAGTASGLRSCGCYRIRRSACRGRIAGRATRRDGLGRLRDQSVTRFTARSGRIPALTSSS